MTKSETVSVSLFVSYAFFAFFTKRKDNVNPIPRAAIQPAKVGIDVKIEVSAIPASLEVEI